MPKNWQERLTQPPDHPDSAPGRQLLADRDVGGRIRGDAVRSQGGGASYMSVGSTTDKLPNLEGWYDAGTLGLSDGASVSSWTDLSGNARHLIQGTGSLQPLFKVSQLNGKPSIRFDGVDDFLSVTGVSFINSGMTATFVLKHLGQAAIGTLVGNASGGGLQIQPSGLLAGQGVSIGWLRPVLNRYYVITIITNASAVINGYLNGLLVNSGPGSVSIDASWGVGCRHTAGTNPLGVDLFEIILNSTILHQSVLGSLHAALLQKYNIMVN